MPSIRAEKADGLLIVTMSRVKANALNAAMVDELNGVLAQSHAHDVRGLVLASDCPKFFSSGFDVTEVFQYDREACARGDGNPFTGVSAARGDGLHYRGDGSGRGRLRPGRLLGQRDTA